MPHKHAKLSQTGIQGRPLKDHEYLKIHRINDKHQTDKSHSLLSSVAEITLGEPIRAQCFGPIVAYIIEGELHVRDESKPDEVIKLFAGDVIHLDENSRNSFLSPNKAKIFSASYTPSHLQPEDYILKK